jgi:hypothetical protein
MTLTVGTEVLAAKPVTVPLCSQLQPQTDLRSSPGFSGEDPANNHGNRDMVCLKFI